MENRSEPPPNTLGGRLYLRRRELNATQHTVARWLGVNQSTIARWEGGDPIHQDRLERVATFLGLSLAEALALRFQHRSGPGTPQQPVRTHAEPSCTSSEWTVTRELTRWIWAHCDLLRGVVALESLGDEAAAAVRSVREVGTLKRAAISWRLIRSLVEGSGANWESTLGKELPDKLIGLAVKVLDSSPVNGPPPPSGPRNVDSPQRDRHRLDPGRPWRRARRCRRRRR